MYYSIIIKSEKSESKALKKKKKKKRVGVIDRIP